MTNDTTGDTQMDATPQTRASKLRTAAVGAGIGMASLIGVGAVTATFAGAQSDDPPATADESTPERGEHLADALAPLVEDGTLTQEQADAVVARLHEAGAEARERWGDRPGRGGHHFPGAGSEAVADLLGMTTDELRDALRGDATLPDLAADAGVTSDQLVDAMLSGVEQRLADKVASGDLTQEQADERLERATEWATAIANGERPERPGHPGDTDE